MPVYPGDKEVNLIKEKDYIENGYNSISIATEMHAGTHIDAPLHMQENKSYISDYPIERFIGNVALLDVRGEKIIDVKDEYYINIKENDIVLLIMFTYYEETYLYEKSQKYCNADRC